MPHLQRKSTSAAENEVARTWHTNRLLSTIRYRGELKRPCVVGACGGGVEQQLFDFAWNQLEPEARNVLVQTNLTPLCNGRAVVAKRFDDSPRLQIGSANRTQHNDLVLERIKFLPHDLEILEDA